VGSSEGGAETALPTSDGGGSTGSASGGSTGTGDTSEASGDDGGCSCASDRRGGGWMMLGLLALSWRRRR
jgi:uncharacterized protein (TIGR03382 family)